ncbi:chaperone protein dnaK [Vibrio ishigakensis]|uniref:Chaperone protein dnaK n=1 Tax=Vibrio ishigakensis TaxID=1481914 RepID=A0A0B8P9T4_9VIBR|nr:chaperone protein dnaK [Vibrio ishigakensis]
MASNQKARYLVGIDLGTTNTVVAFCENTSPLADSKVELFHIDQLIGQGEVARRHNCPLFASMPRPTSLMRRVCNFLGNSKESKAI